MKLTTTQVAQRLGISERHVRRLIDERKLIAERVSGKDWMITESSVEAFEARNKKIQEAMDSFVKDFGATMIVTSPETSNRMQEDGLPIQSNFIPFDEYLVTLFQEKRKQADEKIKNLPLLKKDLGDAVATALYNEFRECFVLGVNGAAITLAILLMEYAMKRRIFIDRFSKDPSVSWEEIEKFSFHRSVDEIKNLITPNEYDSLITFNTEVRNNYIHYKIQTLIKEADMVISKLPTLNTNTGETKILENVDVNTMPHLWFSAKRKLDQDTVVGISKFCIGWTNKLLSK